MHTIRKIRILVVQDNIELRSAFVKEFYKLFGSEHYELIEMGLPETINTLEHFPIESKFSLYDIIITDIYEKDFPVLIKALKDIKSYAPVGIYTELSRGKYHIIREIEKLMEPHSAFCNEVIYFENGILHNFMECILQAEHKMIMNLFSNQLFDESSLNRLLDQCNQLETNFNSENLSTFGEIQLNYKREKKDINSGWKVRTLFNCAYRDYLCGKSDNRTFIANICNFIGGLRRTDYFARIINHSKFHPLIHTSNDEASLMIFREAYDKFGAYQTKEIIELKNKNYDKNRVIDLSVLMIKQMLFGKGKVILKGEYDSIDIIDKLENVLTSIRFCLGLPSPWCRYLQDEGKCQQGIIRPMCSRHFFEHFFRRDLRYYFKREFQKVIDDLIKQNKSCGRSLKVKIVEMRCSNFSEYFDFQALEIALKDIASLVSRYAYLDSTKEAYLFIAMEFDVRCDGRLKLEIWDQGKGIPEDELRRLIRTKWSLRLEEPSFNFLSHNNWGQVFIGSKQKGGRYYEYKLRTGEVSENKSWRIQGQESGTLYKITMVFPRDTEQILMKVRHDFYRYPGILRFWIEQLGNTDKVEDTCELEDFINNYMSFEPVFDHLHEEVFGPSNDQFNFAYKSFGEVIVCLGEIKSLLQRKNDPNLKTTIIGKLIRVERNTKQIIKMFESLRLSGG